jgi:hypothetical protein
MRGEDTVKNIKAQRIKWRGHLSRVEITKTVRNITERNPIGMRTRGRPKSRGENEELNDLKILKVKKWTHLVRNRKPGVNRCRRPRPTKGCRVSSSSSRSLRRRRRRRRQKLLGSNVPNRTDNFQQFHKCVPQKCTV